MAKQINKRMMGLMRYLDANKRNGKTKKEIACEINRNPLVEAKSKYTTYYLWLRGKNNVKPSMYDSIAKAFNIEPKIFNSDLSLYFDEDGNLIDKESLHIALTMPYPNKEAVNYVEMEKVGRITFEPFKGFDSPDINENIKTSGKDIMTILGSFHTQEVRVLKRDDAYVFGIRADTHLFEFGYSEYDDKKYMIHTSNHKGQRIIDIFTY